MAPPFTVTVSVKSIDEPAGRSAKLQVTVPLECEQAPLPTDEKVVCAGTAIVTTGLWSAERPSLSTWRS